MKPAAASAPAPIVIEQHYPPSFYAALLHVSVSTIVRAFRDRPGVIKLAEESKNGKRTRVELRIPYEVFKEFCAERSR
jgi:hypothetical protein